MLGSYVLQRVADKSRDDPAHELRDHNLYPDPGEDDAQSRMVPIGGAVHSWRPRNLRRTDDR